MTLEYLPQIETGTDTSLSPLLTVVQVSQITGRSVSTLEKDRLEGYGPPYVKMGRLVRYRPDDVKAYLAERVRRSTADPGDPKFAKLEPKAVDYFPDDLLEGAQVVSTTSEVISAKRRSRVNALKQDC
jgi:predicted DNA-binding transcriptional regulator AlpA